MSISASSVIKTFVSFVCFALSTGAAQAAPVLVDSTWLEQHLGDSRVVIVDMTDDDLQYTRFHMPGAVRLAFDAVGKQINLPPDHAIAMFVAIGKGIKEPFPRGGQLPLSEVVVEDRFA
jgi:hypothetical protein